MTRATINFSNLYSDLLILKSKAPNAARAIAIEMAALSANLGKSEGIINKKTGNLRSTSRVEVTPDSILFITGGIIGNPSKSGYKPVFVDYAYFVNNGTSKIYPSFFMEKSVAAANIKSGQIYHDQIRKWLAFAK